MSHDDDDGAAGEVYNEENEYMELYKWIDSIPLSRPKRNMTRDFSDGVLMSEVVAHYFPRLVDLHNYAKTSQMSGKIYNWKALNQKVFRRMGFLISEEDIQAIAQCEKGAVEEVLLFVQEKMADFRERREARRSGGPDAGQQAGELGDEDFEAANAARVSPVPAGALPRGTAADRTTTGGSTRHRSTSGRSASTSVSQAAAGGSAANPAAPAPAASGARTGPASAADVDDLRATVAHLSSKVDRLEQLLLLKDAQVDALTRRLDALSSSRGAHVQPR